MNILFFTKYYYPHIGGVEKHAVEVAERLVKKGHQVTVITLKYDSKLPTIEKRGGVTIVRLPYSENKLSIWKKIWQHKALIAKADTIHCHDVFFWYWPTRLLNPFKKVFITFHGWEGEYPIPFKYKFIRKISELLSWGNICIGDYLPKHYGTNSEYISYGGVSQLKLDQPTNVKAKEIIFVGRLEKDLGLDEYLKAIKTLKTKHQLKVTFIGDGPYREEASKFGRVTGMVKDIKPFLKKPCLVFCSSYLTILETMQAGKPIFALYQNQLKKDYLTLFPGAKYINISASANELIAQVTKHLQGTSLQTKKAKSFVKTQTWDKVLKMYLDLWQN